MRILILASAVTLAACAPTPESERRPIDPAAAMMLMQMGQPTGQVYQPAPVMRQAPPRQVYIAPTAPAPVQRTTQCFSTINGQNVATTCY